MGAEEHKRLECVCVWVLVLVSAIFSERFSDKIIFYVVWAYLRPKFESWRESPKQTSTWHLKKDEFHRQNAASRRNREHSNVTISLVGAAVWVLDFSIFVPAGA